VPPLVLVAHRVPVRGVEYVPGKPEFFIRGQQVVELAPELANGVRAVAKKYQCEL
jgi:hypothetical protein